MARAALVTAAVLALAGGTAVSATAAQAPAAAHGARAAARDYRRVSAVTHRPGIAACLSLIRTNVRPHSEAFFRGAAPVGIGYGPADLLTAAASPGEGCPSIQCGPHPVIPVRPALRREACLGFRLPGFARACGGML